MSSTSVGCQVFVALASCILGASVGEEVCDGSFLLQRRQLSDDLGILLNVGGSPAYCTGFANPPMTPYYWEPECKMGMTGCNADGAHVQCRFCEHDGVACPASGVWRPATAEQCSFPNEPHIPYFFDKTCQMGQLGCLADGVHVECRFCGEGDFASVQCPAAAHRSLVQQEESQLGGSPAYCTGFANPPMTPYYWEPECKMGMTGCNADGAHVQCRFCEHDGVACPASGVWRPATAEQCSFPNEPHIPYFFDKTCQMGQLGCLADGVHVECRFCGEGDFASVQCP